MRLRAMADVKDYPPYLDYPKERKKQTNGDRIRQMSDGELVYLIGRFGCPANKSMYGCSKIISGGLTECWMCWLDWLKQEVESDEL